MSGKLLHALVAAVVLSAFGTYLIWQGFTGNVMKSSLSESLIPRWLYIVAGLGLLLLPMIYFITLALYLNQ